MVGRPLTRPLFRALLVGPRLSESGQSERTDGQSGNMVVVYAVTNTLGAMVRDADETVMEAVLSELDGPEDDEHLDVSLSHESGWTLSAYRNGVVVWENVEEGDQPRHLMGVPRSELMRLWMALASGRFDLVDAEPWLLGYGPEA